MPDNRQLRTLVAACLHRIPTEPQEVENQRVNDLEWQSVLLLEKRLDEDICCATTLGPLGRLLCRDVAKSLQRCRRVKHWDRNSCENSRDNVRFSQSAHSTSDQREKESLEPGSRLVQSLLKRLKEMHVELFGLLDIFAHALEDDVLHEDLGNLGCGRDEDLGGFVAGVWCPFVGAGELDNLFPVRNSRENLEGLGELSGFVAGKEEADPKTVSKVVV